MGALAWWGVGAGLLALVAGAFGWGWLRLRRSVAEVTAAIARVGIDDVPRLREECERVLLEKFSERLSLDRLEESARILSRRIDDGSLKSAFAKDDFWWYFVLPVGAYVGELLRVNAGGEWKDSDGGGLELVVSAGDDHATTFPFDKVLKQATVGDKGDLYAYLVTAQKVGELLQN